MSFRGNGRKRNPKYILSSLFMALVGVISIIMTRTAGWSSYWDIVGIVVLFLAVIMFKNANEL